MDIHGIKTDASEVDNVLFSITNAFFSGLMWTKESQEKPSGCWNNHSYTCMAVIQLSVVDSDLLSGNLKKAVQYIESSQHRPGIFVPSHGGGEPTLHSICLGICALYSTGQRLNHDALKQSLNFIENWITKIK